MMDENILDENDAVSVEKLDTFAYINKGYLLLKNVLQRGFSAGY